MHEGYQPVIDYLSKYLPGNVAKPAPGSTTRLIEIKDGKVYWQGEVIPEDAQVPMSFK